MVDFFGITAFLMDLSLGTLHVQGLLRRSTVPIEDRKRASRPLKVRGRLEFSMVEVSSEVILLVSQSIAMPSPRIAWWRIASTPFALELAQNDFTQACYRGNLLREPGRALLVKEYGVRFLLLERRKRHQLSLFAALFHV